MAQLLGAEMNRRPPPARTPCAPRRRDGGPSKQDPRETDPGEAIMRPSSRLTSMAGLVVGIAFVASACSAAVATPTRPAGAAATPTTAAPAAAAALTLTSVSYTH